MKKYLSHILVSAFLLTILVGVGGSAFPQTVHAQIDWSKKPWEVGSGVISAVVAPISLLILKITSLLTALSGGILNFVVDYTIVKMAVHYKDMDSISSAWGTVRDVANMGFIFILLYASIQMILGIGKDTRKLIVNIIIAALLINFSMFFTQIIIDAANIIALTFYHAIVPTAVTGNILDAGLSNSLMRPLGLTSLWDTVLKLDSDKLAILGVMGSVVTLIAAFIFFAVALMLVIRYVVLIFVLILSPIAFIGDVIPGASGYAKDWRKALFGQAFFAPVYMFLTWITIKIFTGPGFPTNEEATWAKVVTGEVTDVNSAQQAVALSGSSISLVFNFIVVIVFLIATLIISKKVSDSAGQGINKLTGKALGLAGGATLGVAGRFGRDQVGRRGAEMLKDEDLKKRAAEGSIRARLQLAAAGKASKSSFDLRGSPLGDALGGGKAKTGGYAQDEKDKAKTYEKYKPSKTTTEAAEKAETETKKNLDEARAKAETKANSEVLKSNELIAAEKAETEAETQVERTKQAGFKEDPNEIAMMVAAQTEAKRLRSEHENKREQYTNRVTSAEREAHETAQKSNVGVKNQMENMAVRAEQGVKIFGFNVPLPGGKSRAAAIRAAAKTKTKKELAAEANIAAAKEDEEEKKKKTEDKEPEPKTPK